MKKPAAVYEKNRRSMKPVGGWKYPAGWESRWVKGTGEISREGTRYYVGEAFVRDYVGLKRSGKKQWEVYFGPKLVGVMYENESGSIRMARYARGG
jgi:hypothetical protein